MTKRNVLKYLSVLILGLLFTCCYHTNNRSLNIKSSYLKPKNNTKIFFVDSSSFCKVIEIPVSQISDSLYPERFYFYEFEEGASVTISDIVLNDDKVYMLSPFCKNIITINIITNEVNSSQNLSNSPHVEEFNDLEYFNNKIYITTNRGVLLYIDPNFSNLDSIVFSRGWEKATFDSYFFKKYQDSIVIATTVLDSSYTIDKHNRVIRSQLLTNDESILLLSGLNMEKGIGRNKIFAYKKEKSVDILTVNNKDFHLIKPFRYISGSIINFDYNEEYLVLYDINKDSFNLYIYPMTKESSQKLNQKGSA